MFSLAASTLSTFCCLMTVVILVRCSVESLAAPAAEPWPVVDAAAFGASLAVVVSLVLVSDAALAFGVVVVSEALVSGLESDLGFTSALPPAVLFSAAPLPASDAFGA